MATFRHAEVTIDAAPIWKAQPTGDALALLGPKHGGFQCNVVVTRDRAANTTAQKFASSHLHEARQAAPDLAVQVEGEARFGKLNGWLREQHFTQQGQRLGQLQLFVAGPQAVYTFTFTDSATALASHRKLFETLLSASTIA